MAERYVPDQENDVLSAIDELVNESLDGYHNRTGYDFSVGDDTCRHCQMSWHGLPRYDCPGSHLSDEDYAAAKAAGAEPSRQPAGDVQVAVTTPDGNTITTTATGFQFSTARAYEGPADDSLFTYDQEMDSARTNHARTLDNAASGLAFNNGGIIGERILTPSAAQRYMAQLSSIEQMRLILGLPDYVLPEPPTPQPETLDAAGARISVYTEISGELVAEAEGVPFSSLFLQRHYQARTGLPFYTASVDVCDMPEDTVMVWMGSVVTRWLVIEHEELVGQVWIKLDSFHRRPGWNCQIRMNGTQIGSMATNALTNSYTEFETLEMIYPSPPVPWGPNHPQWVYRIRHEGEPFPTREEADHRLSRHERNRYAASPSIERRRRLNREAEIQRYRRLQAQAGAFMGSIGLMQVIPGTFGRYRTPAPWNNPMFGGMRPSYFLLDEARSAPCERVSMSPGIVPDKPIYWDSVKVRRAKYDEMMAKLGYTHDFREGKTLNVGEIMAPEIAQSRDTLFVMHSGRGWGRSMRFDAAQAVRMIVRDHLATIARELTLSLTVIEQAMQGLRTFFDAMRVPSTSIVPFWAQNPTQSKRPRTSKSSTRRKYGRR